MAIRLFICCVLLAVNATADDDAKALYEKRCFGCHSLEHNRIGPRHNAVFGRKIASLADYDYSTSLLALAAKDIYWTEENLDAWLKNPGAFAPGNKMGSRVISKKDRAMIINFLKTLIDDP